MKNLKICCVTLTALLLSLILASKPASAQLKIGYINSNKILETYQEAIDVKKKLQEINTQWEREAKDMQKELKEKQEQLEAQSLLLSEERKQEKGQEIQNLYLKYQQFLNEKWGQQGEAVKKEMELFQPVYDKINATIKKIGAEEGYHYIFDVVAGNILYASEDQPDLTDKLLEELNKGLPAKTNSGEK
ncbi:MAG: OmpH family outer membrane protein [bacterium]